MGWGCLGTDVLLPHLGFYLVPAQLPLPLLPLQGSVPLPGASACLTPVCWSTPGIVLEGSLLRHLGFLPCAVLFLRACSVRCFPCCRFPSGFQVTGCLSFCFPGDVGWASALPFFSGLLLLYLLAGVVGVLHPVSGCSCCGDVCLLCG